MIYRKQSVCYETVEMFRTCSLLFQFKTSIFRPSKTFPPSLTMCTCENGNWPFWHMHMQSWRKKGIRVNISFTISQWIQHVFQKQLILQVLWAFAGLAPCSRTTWPCFQTRDPSTLSPVPYRLVHRPLMRGLVSDLISGVELALASLVVTWGVRLLSCLLP